MNPPEGWIQHTHPEGSTFFYNSALRLFTDNNARDDTVRAHLETAHGDIQRQRDEQKMHYTDMYIRITTGTSPVSCEYYLIDHINRNVFWTNDMTSTDLELQDGVSGTQFGETRVSVVPPEQRSFTTQVTCSRTNTGHMWSSSPWVFSTLIALFACSSRFWAPPVSVSTGTASCGGWF
jgi:hypothetical protein